MATSDERQMKPEPMRLVLLDQMHLQAQGTKIRFLGWSVPIVHHSQPV